MAVDPRFERLPEHEGPAFRTWQLIMQTTMGSVVQQSTAPAGPILNNNVKSNKSKFTPADDFISLNTEKSDSETGDLDSNNKSKKKKEDSGPCIPWKTRDYPENPVG